MKFLKTFESKKFEKRFWKIQPTSSEYMEVALNKVGMPEDAVYYNLMINLRNELSKVDMFSGKNELCKDDQIRYGPGGWMFHNDGTLFLSLTMEYGEPFWSYNINSPAKYVNNGYEYKGEIRVEPWEIEAMKYNL